MRHYRNFIDNQFKTSDGATLLEVVNPATEDIVATVDSANPYDADEAVRCAAAAQKKWRRLPAIERGKVLHRLADALVARADDIGRALALESGKSPQHARSEVLYAAEVTRYHAEWARRITGEVIPSDNASENLLLYREPIGVVVCLVPFNSPVYTLLRKLAPALITGNTVIVRPSSYTPCSALEIARAVQEADVPPGVINILAMNHQVAEQICTHPAIGMITLTGSVGAGRKVLEYSQVNIAKVALELGGQTPAIIEPDADLEKAADDIVRSKTTNCGQLCTAVERVYVNEAVASRFIDLLRNRMRERQWGDRSKNHDWMGPLIHDNARLHIHQMVARAIDDGAVLECGGVIPSGKGFFYPPTLLTGCRQDMEIVQEETFGPVLAVVVHKTLDEALAMANDHQFGLASMIYSQNHGTIMRVANEIEAGECYVNRVPDDPYQGHHAGWKRSGIGGDDGQHGMLAFTQTRLVVMPY
ncbi:Lactaldehyde dehydrogenase [Paraburkholderia piptadeniae]|uniref:Lactaldehyde dehydrogenase n=1 Tax=Paraburkholderia piptadeniae TaxID=1701573 RepID=A0A1N7SG51_9BURK|nr:aldehyde dehydrogenase [Paraburkholderia piptadeniae]SIT46367.1 Lactaldehyde dehydrogenase [Paraburkholderia piptadeniae]